MSIKEAESFNFKKIPKVLNTSGASTITFSETSTPFSVKTASTSVSNTPLSHRVSSGIPKEYKFNLANTTPISIRRKYSKTIDNHNCSFCNLPLQNVFEGEKIVDLQCGHVLHFECLKELLTPSSVHSDHDLANPNERLKNELVCPGCNEVTSCVDDTILLNDQLMCLYDNVINPGNNFSDIMATIDNFEILNMPLTNTTFESPVDTLSTNLDDPITPQNQMGMNFWEEREDAVIPIAINSNASTKHQNSPTISQSGIEMAKLLFAPEYSTINISDKSKADIGCVVNISVPEFESSIQFDKKEQIKTQIGKNKITNAIIDRVNESVYNSEIDFSTCGSLILFDFIDITIKFNMFTNCQVYLFELSMIILNNDGTQLILSQTLNSQTFISSIYSNENDIIINLNSIKIPSIKFTSDNKILRHKWYVTLNKMMKKISTADTIPLIQTSTNAWMLISTDDDNDVLPHEIKVFNKLISRGLDLPSGFLKRQILRPDTIPLTLIVAIPLINSEDYGLENNEYADVIKGMISKLIKSMHEDDKLGVVFIGNHINNSSTLGNYYGCVSKSWVGWDTMLDSITENVVSEEGEFAAEWLWNQTFKYIELLASLGFNKVGTQNIDSLHQVICISNLLIGDFNSQESNKGKNSGFLTENPFLKKRKQETDTYFNERILNLCNKYDVNFNMILLADEFKYEVNQIFEMNKYLKQQNQEHLAKELLKYDNKIKLSVALDFENLDAILQSLLDVSHDTTIRKLETCISFPKYITLKGVEELNSMGGIVNIVEGNENGKYVIQLQNIPSGYEKSLLFHIHIDLEEENNFSNYKTLIASSKTRFIINKEITEFDTQGYIKFIPKDSNVESNITLNLSIEKANKDGEVIIETAKESFMENDSESDLNLSIVSRLSNVSDAYFIRRKIQLVVAAKLREVVLEVKDFDTLEKERAKNILSDLTHTIWEFANSCNSSNTINIRDNSIEKWAEKLNEELEDIIDGYSLRNYQLSNMKCMSLFLEIA